MSDPATDFQDGFDMKVERSIDSGANWTPIAGVKSFGVPEVSRASREVTSLDSPTGWREKRGGLKEVGATTIRCNYTRVAYAAALADAAQADPVLYRVTAKNGDEFQFPGIPTISPEFDIEGETQFDIKIEGAGALTWTAGA